MIQYIVDAFTDTLFAGNPAAVLPCRQMPSPEMMQAIAIENNYSETAFVVKRGPAEYDLKWYTPGGEVELCGHATLATSFVLHHFIESDAEELHFHTLSGELIVRPGADGYTMVFPVGQYKSVPVTEKILAATNGLAREAWYASEAMRLIDSRGLIITARSKEYDFVSRCFYPKLNVPEDPVTGNAVLFMRGDIPFDL